jgi:GPH family glycoside/pentoside/hexuronide:cation symporter
MAGSIPKLRFLTKVTYGVGSSAYGVAGTALGTSTVQFYLNQVVGIPAALAALAIGLSLVIDAIVDPMIGQWTDNTHTRWGRRHPFMYAAAVPCAAACYFLWHAPAGWSPYATFGFMLGMLVLMRFSVALYETASTALTPELAPDYHARTGLISYRFFFLVAGSGTMGISLGAFFLHDKLDKVGYANFGTAAAIAMFVTIMISSLATHHLIPLLRRSERREISATQMFKEIAGTLSNPSLIVLMTSGLLSGIAGGVGATLGLYFNFYFWALSPKQYAVVGLAGFFAALVGTLLAPHLSRRFGKKPTMLGLFFGSLFTGILPVSLRLLDLMPANGSPWVLTILVADSFVAGTLALMGFVIVYSMIADVVEDAAVKTGVRSEGLLFAANGLLPKVSAAVGGVIGGLLLQDVIRFPTANPKAVTPEILHTLGLVSLPVGIILNGLAIAVLVFYRIDQATHEANVAKLRDGGVTPETEAVLEAQASTRG